MQLDTIHYSLGELTPILDALQCKRVFLVRGKKSFQLLDARFNIKESLKGFEVCQFSDFSTNPKYEDAMRGIDEIMQFQADVIVAIGGGSALDMAKAIKAGASNLTHFNSFFKANKELRLEKSIPMIAVPTTAGTGSETTHFAVIYYENRKYSLAHPQIKPEMVILDHRLPQEAPFEVKCAAAIDALSQAIEGIWSKNCTDEAFSYGIKAFQLIYSNIEEAIVNNDPQAMKNLSLGAFYAGKTIDISKTTAPHAFSYRFTSLLNIPHGQAVAITLPFFITYNCQVTLEEGLDSAHERAFNRIKQAISTCGLQTISDFEQWLWHIYDKLQIRMPIKRAFSSFKAFNQEIIQEVNFERLGNNPRQVIPTEISKPLFTFITQKFSL